MNDQMNHIFFNTIESSSLSVIDLISILISVSLVRLLFRVLRKLPNIFRKVFLDDICQNFVDPNADQFTIHPNPNGWAPIAETEQLGRGKVLKVRALGREFVLVRDLKGEIHAMDPYCPHNGAHLGGGEVLNIRGEDCLRCPFHEWSFRVKDGVCIDVPYAKDGKPPKGSTVKTWPCIEHAGFICVWFHNKGEDPSWFPELTKSEDFSQLNFYGRARAKLNCDVYMIVENTADFSHFIYVHDKPFPLTGRFAKMLGFEGDLFEQKRQHLSWKAMKNVDSHKARLEMISSLVFGRNKMVNSDFSATQLGPYLSDFDLNVKSFGISLKLRISAAVISLHSNKQEIVFRVYSPKGIIGYMAARSTLMALSSNIKRDCEIWQNMKRVDKPMFVKEEKAMVELRRWFTQFYDGASNCSIKSADG
ncbi:cholesterol 7-desaturase nvd-like [Brevipalpus obovatus]|uniref:cholesterol 7-desaturase nvd-like n=1 Tax=Brevipalpus obovatus TaxID=246614 RepID=UPI003D9F3576